jgi:uncharacterized protein YndB with AHSA1/START domain
MTITIDITVAAPSEKVWTAWTSPAHITEWNFASDNWACPRADLDLRPGGKFNYRMEAKDGSMGFDFEGEFTSIETNRRIEYSLGDGRKVTIDFVAEVGGTRVVESFEAEDEHSAEQQKQGWHDILINFKKHVESL